MEASVDKWTEERRIAMRGKKTQMSREINAMLIGSRRARVEVDEEIAKERPW